MKLTKLIFSTIFFLLVTVSAYSSFARIAKQEDVNLLKKDVQAGKIQIGKTRLKEIREVYGVPDDISETRSKITYNYGDLRIDFDKFRYFRKWEYDYSHPTAYSDEIDDLRYDLGDQQIVGDYYTLEEIKSNYEEPTEAYETQGDGNKSIYYYCG